MTRRTHACLTCPGRTRHDNQICAACRRSGVYTTPGQVHVPLRLDRLSLVYPANPAAPTRAELEAGTDLTHLLAGIRDWHGTDCGCTRCAADRVPGRSA